MRFSLLLALASVFLAASASAQVRFLPYIGYNMSAGVDFEESFENEEVSETGAFLVGVGAEFGLTPGILPVAVKIRPSVETAFLSGEDFSEAGIEAEASQSLLQANLDLIGEFSPPLAPVGVFAGVGAAFATYSAEFETNFPDGDSEVDDSAFGVNFLGGLRFGGGFISPFIQGRYTLLTLQPGADDLDDDEEFPEEEEINGGFSILAGVSIGL